MNRDKKTQRFEEYLGTDLVDIMANAIWQDTAGYFHVFARYTMNKAGNRITVFRGKTLAGEFSSWRNALGWCIADKYGLHRLSRQILALDSALTRVRDDIKVRSAAARRSDNALFAETVMTKLETKITHAKHLEEQLNKSIGTVRQFQNQGFYNETIRTGRKTANRER